MLKVRLTAAGFEVDAEQANGHFTGDNLVGSMKNKVILFLILSYNR